MPKGVPKSKRVLKPRVAYAGGAIARRQRRSAQYRQESREAILLSRKLGCPISEARAILEASKC